MVSTRTSTSTDSISGAVQGTGSLDDASVGEDEFRFESQFCRGFTKSMGTMSILGSLCIIAFSPGPAAKPG